MDVNKDGKRKKDKQNDDDYNKEKKSKRARTRSRSPAEARERNSKHKRRHSRSRSYDRPVKQERKRDDPPKETEVRKDAPERKTKEKDMLNTRTGGAYIPPARLRMMQAQITDKSSIAYQRLAWEALKKSIHGHINKINIGNIGIIIKELLKENIVRGRGLLCRSVVQAQAASPTFTNVFAALVSAVNSRFPNIGELLLKRLVIQFKRGFKRNDKPICISSASFIAHLVNQRVAHEILALELLTLLVETPTDDSIEVAIAFLKECGQKLTEVSSKGVNAIFEMLRNILHEGQLDKRVQYMIEVMFQVWKDGFKDHPALIEELELVPEEEQFTHLLMLDDATDPQDILNVFKFDEKFEENEQKYETLCKEILGSDAESGEEEGESGSEGSDEEDGEGERKEMTIIDNTETNLVALRRTIYLTINSSLDFEECAHKLMKMQLKPGQEVELCHMFLDCCAEQRTYEKFYGLLAQRFCNINRIYIGPFEEIFKDSYSTAHRLDTNRLRNVSKFFAHLLFTDSIGWEVLECVKLNEEDTTSSSRIYIKILFQELAEYMGLKKLNDRLKDPTLQEAFLGIFPRDNPKNTRFSINFFTSIGLGGLTDELREHLKQMPKNLPPPITEIKLDSDSSSDSSSSSSSSDDSSSSSDSSSSDSDEEGNKKENSDKNKKSKKNKNKDKTPKTPEGAAPPQAADRWGHDGFYETYGENVRRNESRPDRQERDKDNFAIPRDVRRNEEYRRNRDSDQRNGDFRREDNRRREDRNRQQEDDSRRRSRGEQEEVPEQRRRERNDRNGNREDPRNRSDNDERRDNYEGESRSRREEGSRSGREEGSRSRKEENLMSRREEESRSRREDDSRSRKEEGYRSRRDEDSRSRREDDSKARKEEESRLRREDDSKARKEDESRSRKEDTRSRKDEDSRSGREDDSKLNKEGGPRSSKEEQSRSKRNDDSRLRNDEEFKSRKENDYRSRKEEEIRSKNEEEYSRSNKKDKDNRPKEDRLRELEKEDNRGKKSDREGKRKKNKNSDSSDEESPRMRRHENIKEKDVDTSKSQRDKKNKGVESDSSEDESNSRRHEKENKNRKEKDEQKSKQDKRRNKSADDSSDDNSKSRRREKENKERDENDKKSKRERKKKESDSSEDESRSKKRDKEKRKNKDSRRDKVSASEKDDEGWDIRRGSSIRKELAAGERYWDN